MEWMPIETAPKDGSDILSYCRWNGQITIVKWTDHGRKFMSQNNHSSCVRLKGQPTDWMPLPKPPKGDE